MKSDDVGDPAKAPAAATTLQQDPAILGVIGPSFSGATKAVAPSYDAAKLVLISPSATNPTLTSQGFKSFHRVVPPDSLEGQEAADWLAKKAKKVYVIDDASDYGKGAADAVQAELKAKTIATVARQRPARRRPTTASSRRRSPASGADALFYGGYDTQAGQFAKALTAAGFKGLTMTGNGGKSSQVHRSCRRLRRRLVLLLRLPRRHGRPGGRRPSTLPTRRSSRPTRRPTPPRRTTRPTRC